MSSKVRSSPSRTSDLVREYINKSSSPRASASSPVSADTMKKAVWTYVAAAVLVFLLLWWVSYSKFHDVHTWAQLPAFLANPVVFALVTLVVLVLAGYVTAHVSKEHLFSGQAHAVSLGLIFLLVGVLVLVTAYLVYRVHNFTAAFYVALVALVLALAHMMVAWRTHRSVALLVIPLVLFLATAVYYLWYMADESANCLTNCSPVFEVKYV